MLRWRGFVSAVASEAVGEGLRVLRGGRKVLELVRDSRIYT